MLRRLIAIITSLKLTILCLVAGMVLIFAGTIAQVHLGIWEAQQRYFQSLFVWWPPEGRGFRIPIFPGGHLIGAVLLINLVAAHAKRFQWAWRKLRGTDTGSGTRVELPVLQGNPPPADEAPD